MKYKIGDKVRIREDLVENKTYYMENNEDIYDEAISEMLIYRGQIATIENIVNGYYYVDLDLETCTWTDEMFELLTERKENENEI